MVSDSELVNRLHEIIRLSDLNTTTPGSVRRQLQTDFGVDLTDRKRFISQQIDEFIQCHMNSTNSSKDKKNDEYDDASDYPKGQGEEGEGLDEDEEEDGGDGIDESDDGGGEEDGDGDDGNDEEEEDGSDGERSKKPRNKNKEPEKKRRGGGFTKLCSLSPQLQEFVGVPELARTEVVKKLWNYIREKSLQDPGNRQNINCDKELYALFGVDSINMFQMNKVLSKHIWPLKAEDARRQWWYYHHIFTFDYEFALSSAEFQIPSQHQVVQGSSFSHLKCFDCWLFLAKNSLVGVSDGRYIIAGKS
ncbi:hypothetical protein Dimus_037454 [Dionaea muscipula]